MRQAAPTRDSASRDWHAWATRTALCSRLVRQMLDIEKADHDALRSRIPHSTQLGAEHPQL